MFHSTRCLEYFCLSWWFYFEACQTFTKWTDGQNRSLEADLWKMYSAPGSVLLSAPGLLWYESFLTLFLRKPLLRFPHHDSLKPSTTGNQKKNSSLKWLYWVFDRSIKNPFKGIPQWPNFFQLVPFFKGSPNGIAGWWASLRCMNLWRTLTQIITSSMCHGRIND